MQSEKSTQSSQRKSGFNEGSGTQTKATGKVKLKRTAAVIAQTYHGHKSP